MEFIPKTASLEDKIHTSGLPEKQRSKPEQGLWDFFTSAYSSGKAIKAMLSLLGAGYSPQAALAATAGVYTGLKLLGKGMKASFDYIRGKPREYKGLRKEIGEFIEELNPFGSYRRPVALGAGITGLSYLTGI